MEVCNFLVVNGQSTNLDSRVILIDLQLIRRKMVESAKESIKRKESNSEIYGKMQAVFIQMDSNPTVSPLTHRTLD